MPWIQSYSTILSDHFNQESYFESEYLLSGWHPNFPSSSSELSKNLKSHDETSLGTWNGYGVEPLVSFF